MLDMQYKASCIINVFFTRGLNKVRRVEEVRKILTKTCDDLIECKNEKIEELKNRIKELENEARQ